MSSEKKFLKKEVVNQKIMIKKNEDNNKDIQENLIIQLKKSYIDDYDISSYDKDKDKNENINNDEKSSKLCWNCCHKFFITMYTVYL